MAFMLLNLCAPALFLSLLKAGSIRAQCTQPETDSSIIQSFSDGSTVTFECMTGHRPVNSGASKSVTCQGTQWTNLELRCTRKSCGSLQDFLNGRYEMTGNLFGDTAKPVCNKGYMLAGKETTRTCRDQGWDGRDPACESVKCSAPPAIEHGQLENVPLESYAYSDAVSYKCNPGLNLIGQSTLHCSEDGTFKPDPPKCFAECTQPSFASRNVILTAEYLSTQSFPDGSTVTFECMTGHRPVNSGASKSVTCQGTQWTNLELSCTRKSCGSLQDIVNGRYEMTGNLFGDTAKPVCNKGYMLAGKETTRTCRDQGWDGRDPVCEPVKCSPPPVIEHGYLEDEPLESYAYSDAVTYTCNPGLNLIGQSTLYCSEDGTFKPDPPTCFAECTQPSFASRNVILTAEYLSTQRFSDGSTVTFECMTGHRPVNSGASKSVTCQGTQWTNLELSCTRKSCGSLQDFLNGRYEMSGNLFGDTAKPVCNKGYMLAGKETTRTCRDGGWDGRDPVCEPVKCSPPLAIENGELVEVPLESYDYLDAVSYRCNPGLNLIGQSTLHCSEDGTFKPDPPKCFDGCPTPTVTNAKRIGGKSPPYKLGNFIQYKCEDGYEMKGEAYIVCRANGWDPEEPSCNALSTTTTTTAVTSKKALSTTTTTTAVTSTVSITSKKGKTDENTKGSSFPTWAIVVICVVLGIVVAVVSLVYVNYRKKRSEHVKVEKEEDQPL
ncbi:complement receptor type 1 isoform X5 [Carassius auratus]|uniref:Complement receptor type 1-like isoform X5 n=1 Tax=Carassius auratus TaxID=7957 RepID=A0A6P6MTG5_CARAU|nr:complement receptor type 1-like isoform X5 [Carassius auratus]XP_026099609.1 complement receptor type 1-like isoform X5 [Carassius auratus]